MKKIFIILTFGLVLTAVAASLWNAWVIIRQPGLVVLTPALALTGLAPIDENPATQSGLSATVDGVEVTIEQVSRQAGNTLVLLALNNHRYDLSSLDILSRTSFNATKPSDYQILQSASGGHHVSSQLTFPGNLSGPLTVGLGDSLTFNFNVN